jgi:hypothetical protein
MAPISTQVDGRKALIQMRNSNFEGSFAFFSQNRHFKDLTDFKQRSKLAPARADFTVLANRTP